MATEVILPRLGQGMESGTIVRWLKSEGEAVEKGEPLFELDTDKVTQEVEAEAAGVLLKIAVAEGEVPVGRTVAFIGSEGEDVPEVAAETPPRQEAKSSEPAPAPAPAAPQGLIVPVMRGVERLSLAEVAAARGDIVGRARDNKLTTQDLEDGTFTISNLGMFGIEQFVAVLNPPQAAIVAVGATEERVVPFEGEMAVRPMVTLTGTFDHRAVDGAPAAAFLQTLKESLEDPGLAL